MVIKHQYSKMALFAPFDNVDKRMFISSVILEKYPNCTFAIMAEWKKRGQNVHIINDAILLYDIDESMLHIIITLMNNNFDSEILNKIICDLYYKQNDMSFYNKIELNFDWCGRYIDGLHKVYQNSIKISSYLSIDISKDNRVKCFLIHLDEILKKYAFDCKINYTYKIKCNISLEEKYVCFCNSMFVYNYAKTYSPFVCDCEKNFILDMKNIAKKNTISFLLDEIINKNDRHIPHIPEIEYIDDTECAKKNKEILPLDVRNEKIKDKNIYLSNISKNLMAKYIDIIIKQELHNLKNIYFSVFSKWNKSELKINRYLEKNNISIEEFINEKTCFSVETFHRDGFNEGYVFVISVDLERQE